MTPTVDAIICYHNHDAVIQDCIYTLRPQVRQCLVVNDGSVHSLPAKDELSGVTELWRDTAHGPANSFNYGAKYSNADWLLYVDPHNLYQAHAVEQMLQLAEADHYDLVFGTGRHYILDGDDPWIHALGPTVNAHEAPWTFLMRRRLWEQWLPPGIPESRYAHMELLWDQLYARGVLVGFIYHCCDHVVNGDKYAVIRYFYEAGRMFAAIYKDGVTLKEHMDIPKLAQDYTPAQIQLLWEMVVTSVYQLGAVEGLGKVPQEDLKLKLGFRWKEGSTP